MPFVLCNRAGVFGPNSHLHTTAAWRARACYFSIRRRDGRLQMLFMRAWIMLITSFFFLHRFLSEQSAGEKKVAGLFATCGRDFLSKELLVHAL